MCFVFPTLFDNTDKCRVLEVFVENPEDVMSLYHVQEMSGVESGAASLRGYRDFQCIARHSLRFWVPAIHLEGYLNTG